MSKQFVKTIKEVKIMSQYYSIIVPVNRSYVFSKLPLAYSNKPFTKS